jgi:aromatic ring-opening dioxygenase catalytic subunit (LigB family)
VSAALAGVACVSHSPGITGFPERADPVAAKTVLGAFDQLAAIIEEVRPDAFIVVSTEHFTNFFVANLPTFAVGTASGYDLPASDAFSSFLKIERRRYPGHSALGEAVYRGLLAEEFDPALVAGGYGFDEAFAVPLTLVARDRDVPVVPILVNAVHSPYPSLARCHRLGTAIRRIVDAQDLAARVIVLGTGGLSHWVGLPGAGTVDTDFDQRVLEAFEEGDAERLLSLTDAEIEASGNGAHEIRAWLVAAGAAGRARFSTLAYEPVPAWLTGTAVVVASPDGSTKSGVEERRHT